MRKLRDLCLLAFGISLILGVVFAFYLILAKVRLEQAWERMRVQIFHLEPAEVPR